MPQRVKITMVGYLNAKSLTLNSRTWNLNVRRLAAYLDSRPNAAALRPMEPTFFH